MTTQIIRHLLAMLLSLLIASCTKNDDPAPNGASLYVQVPDVNFEKALIKQKIDDIQDGKLLVANARNVAVLTVYGQGINSLQGLEAFVNLTTLDCTKNKLTHLDVSKNPALIRLLCYDNQLTTLDVSRNTALTYLYCHDNQLTILDMSTNLLLKTLICSYNGLTRLVVSRNKMLSSFDCHDNKLGSLDISQNTALTELVCSNNSLTRLDIIQNTRLTNLVCSRNRLTKLDLRHNLLLHGLTCLANQIQTICVANLANVKTTWTKDASAMYQVCE